jgi:quercetin dioxygenase-like cupin family protein
MHRALRDWSRAHVAGALTAAAVAAGIFGQAHAPSAQQAQSNFVGGGPTRESADRITTARLRFAKGSRSNWHIHSWGQLLMVEEGSGLTQERGGPLRAVRPGQPWFTKAGVEHWHGASPTEDMLQLTIYEGTVKWLGPVSDAEYLARPAAK